jgi:hypothetical protein
MNENFKYAIKLICERLENKNIRWALVGSTNMNLQGIDINPNDLDIIVQLEDLSKIREIFSDFDVSKVKELEPLSELDTKKFEVTFLIDNVPIQVIGEGSEGLYVSKFLNGGLVKFSLDSVKVPCFALEAEAQTYSETDREHKSTLIREFLGRE